MADVVEAAPNRAKLVLPVFKGDTNAPAALSFIRKVNAYQQVTQLDNAQTAQAVAFSFPEGSKAALWLRNLESQEADVAADWEQLRERLRTRFSPVLTPSERATILDEIRQARDEEVATFADRCVEAQITLERDLTAAQKAEAGFERAHNDGIRDMFLRGLREADGFKKTVNSAPNCATFAEFLTAAIRIERHSLPPKPSVVIAEVCEGVDVDPNDDNAEVAELTAGQRQARKKGQPGNRPQPRQEGGTPRACWTCASTEHLQRACPQRQGGGGRGASRGGGRGRGRNNGGGRRGGQQQPQGLPPLKWGIHEIAAQQHALDMARLQLQQQAVSVNAMQQLPGTQQQMGGWPPQAGGWNQQQQQLPHFY